MDEEKKEIAPVEAYKLFYIEKNDQRSYSFEGGIINLELGVPKTCVDLYRKGAAFPYLKLKKGADVLFTGLSEVEILKLISQTKSKSDVQILSRLIKSSDGKSLITKRLQELKTPH